LNYGFTSLFLAEAAIKLLGTGITAYFSDNWNRFDFGLAIGSVVGIISSMYTSGVQIKGAVNLLRVFRVLRILRLLKRGGRSIHLIFNTFVITLHTLINVGGLLLLILYMYAVLGMILFGEIMRNGIMNAYINFENFFNALVTLFTVATGDSWNAIQTSFVVSPTPIT
jgi:hypothetical protein